MTRMLHVDSVKYGLNRLILMRLNIAALHFSFTWCLRERCLSNQAPKYLITSVLCTGTPFMLIWCVVHLLSWHLDPNIMNSVFTSFILSLLPSIHDLILVAHCSRSLMVFTLLSLKFPGKPFLYAWLSANPCKSMGLLEFNCQVLSDHDAGIWLIGPSGWDNGSCMTP